MSIAHQEVIRQIYISTDNGFAEAWIDDIACVFTDAKMAVAVRRLDRSIGRWYDQIVTWPHPQVSHPPTEAVKNLVKRVKRVAFVFPRSHHHSIR